MKKMKTNAKLLIALFLIMTFAIPEAFLATDFAAAELTWHAYITVNPNPAGVGQDIVVIFGITMPTSRTPGTGYSGWTVTVTNPSGTIKQLGPFNADPTGATYTVINCDVVGTWKVKATYPGGQALMEDPSRTNPTLYNVSAVSTDEISFTVQQEPAPYASSNAPLPTNYWGYPINAENGQQLQTTG